MGTKKDMLLALDGVVNSQKVFWEKAAMHYFPSRLVEYEMIKGRPVLGKIVLCAGDMVKVEGLKTKTIRVFKLDTFIRMDVSKD